MKVAAHPMVVAVALGLLGPTALAEEERRERTPECSDCGSDAREAAVLEMSELAPSVDEGEWHRVEQAWLEAREGL